MLSHGDATRGPANPAAVGANELDAPAVRSILESATALRTVFQPIVDLHRGVTAGYEALSRFPAGPGARPDQWFAAAAEHGLGADLEAHALGKALEAKSDLPAGAFLSVNVSPRLLHTAPVRAAFGRPGDLGNVVVELTEHVPYGETDALVRHLDWLRARGARIALDDTGTGYSGLRQIADLRPDVIKLDRAFVDRLDRDEVKAVFAEFLTTVASRLDALLLAEGVERVPELDRLIALGVPLAQGWLLGRPDAPWSALPTPTVQRVRSRASLHLYTDVAEALLEDAPVMDPHGLPTAPVAPAAQSGEVVVTVVLDRVSRPIALAHMEEDGTGNRIVRTTPVTLRAFVTTPLRELALRAVTRPAPYRFDPVVCTTEDGRYLGLVRIDRLLAELAGQTTPGG